MLTIINPPPPHRTTFPAKAGEVRDGKIVYVDPMVGEVGATDWKEDFLPASLECARIDKKPVNPRFLARAVKPRQSHQR